MKVNQLIANNINKLDTVIPFNKSLGIAGLSGSGKTTLCQTIGEESKKRLVSLLPKAEYQYLFPNIMETNFSAIKMEEMPLVLFLGKSSISSNPRSTIGTHTGVFKEIREKLAEEFNLSPEVFSFNNQLGWCAGCKGRGTTKNIECKKCKGKRYSEEVEQRTIELFAESHTISDINDLSVESILSLAEELNISEAKQHILQNIINMNIGYLTLNRIMGTLSGGELTRLYLAEFMAVSENAVIIIDEISVGLDHETLLQILEEIEKLGYKNQIWLIDHSDTVLDTTDEQMFFGPGSGKYGGKIVKESPRPKPILSERNYKMPTEYYTFHELYCRNIQMTEFQIPKNRLVTVTGESGCGKSTLVNECLATDFLKRYPKDKLVMVGQDRNQSITSRSTVATFLDIKKKLTKYSEEIDDIFERSIEDIIDEIPNEDIAYKRLSLLIKLGLGYLTLERKTQTLSTGEFQCVHLVSELFAKTRNPHTLFIFDEPSKGLSQNILNQFIDSVRGILQDESVSIIMIEHNSYMLESSDYIVDFGKRQLESIEHLDVVSHDDYYRQKSSVNNAEQIHISSTLNQQNGINYLEENHIDYFKNAENIYKGGILKSLSSMARLIYGEYESDTIAPVVAIDLERHLYSQYSFLYEIGGLINHIVAAHPTNKDTRSFDFYSQDNHCPSCSGRLQIEVFDKEITIQDKNVPFWDGLFDPEIMKVLKFYQYEKIEFLFEEIKNELGHDLSKSYNDMSEEEKHTFWYGYFDKSFYDKKGKTRRTWVGFNTIIGGYIVISKAAIKEDIKTSKEMMTCPICEATVLNHQKSLKFGDTDIREIINQPLNEIIKIVGDLPVLIKLKSIVGDNMIMTEDVSLLPRKTQVALKMFELEQASFSNYEMVLQNVLPFWSQIKGNIESISNNNKVTICDFQNINETRETIIDKYFTNGKYKKLTYVYEAFGYKKLVTQINKIKKSNPCPFCNGKKVITEDNLHDGVFKLTIPCITCNASGINDEGLKEIVDGIDVQTWLTGKVSDVVDESLRTEDVPDILIFNRIRELNKREMMAVYECLEKNN
ncbi:ATP-binding cassette domain-containing protein [Bacillus mycoides]|uniref:UvrABC system protein A n=1 Tax=Bacillus cereus (strain VD146) TaxID=1053236 RepID=R8N3A9_BACCX|nr:MULTISPECIES: ATP-binding cassette domain-containing protein [Bacillus cereus group]EOP40603.1 excinuclease ABC subunit A [Bacillus cereus VD146]MDR4901901.1 ATP-binding cassette domain-containing protein [Bacillus mycoides]MED1045997.1 ATP-binding cassette domain-containing protein [Bacillus mycoides]MED1050894.1 ATP-binding cassette domain-containing protein [Bacillus mycoides]MED1087954.1 ATP-binding cassette domain-containing protein [Bacillus mycoides]